MEALLALRPPEAPPGFDDFWRTRYTAALLVQPHPHLDDSKDTHPDWLVRDISYTSTDGFRIGGWLLLPRKGKVKRGLVVGHGYGGREAPDFDIPVSETAILFPCLRGISRSAKPPIPGDPPGHVLTGIDARDHYILGGCVEDIWLAVSALLRFYPWLQEIGYSGISFGGGIGSIATAFDRRITRGHLIVPTFGNMPLWLSLPTTGSSDSVQTYRRKYRNVLDTLAYFDAATAATRIDKPMLFAVARFDPVVAPPCQFSIANALSSNGHETVILDAGHFDYPGAKEQHALLADKVGRFFGAA
jgi:cephalosporin-C deacetylase